MAWIESHQSLGRHPKLLRLAERLRIHRAQAVGHLKYLWWWALDYAPTGDVSALTSAEISAASEWPGDAGSFDKALRDAGWIDADGCIHDWDQYAGPCLLSRERQKRYREKTLALRNANITETATLPNQTVPDQPDQPIKPKPPHTPPKTGGAKVLIPEDLLASEKEISDWLAYKAERGQRYKPKGLEALWRSFRAIPPGRRRASVDHCMANNWSGLFEKRDGFVALNAPIQSKRRDAADEVRRLRENPFGEGS